MSIASIVTRGYSNGTFTGTIALVTARGYSIGAAVSASATGGRSRSRRRLYPDWTEDGRLIVKASQRTKEAVERIIWEHPGWDDLEQEVARLDAQNMLTAQRLNEWIKAEQQREDDEILLLMVA